MSAAPKLKIARTPKGQARGVLSPEARRHLQRQHRRFPHVANHPSVYDCAGHADAHALSEALTEAYLALEEHLSRHPKDCPCPWCAKHNPDLAEAMESLRDEIDSGQANLQRLLAPLALPKVGD